MVATACKESLLSWEAGEAKVCVHSCCESITHQPTEWLCVGTAREEQMGRGNSGEFQIGD